MSKVDFSELVIALRKGDNTTADALLKEVMPRLVEYLRVVMNASPLEADECAQQAFMVVYDRIRKGKLKKNKTILSYLMRSARNEYLRYVNYQHRFAVGPDAIYHAAEPAEQIENLIEKERILMLEQCLDELGKESRNFITYFIDNPEKTTKQASKRFKISSANIRTKKSRLINRLHHCVKRKTSE